MNYEELFDLELRIVVRYLKTIKNKKEYNYVLQSYININKLCYEELLVSQDKEAIYEKYCNELINLVKKDYEIIELLEYLNTYINKGNFNAKNIDDCVIYCIDNLDLDFSSYTKDILNKMLFIIYLEYFYLNTTNLLDNIKKDDFYTDCMNVIIKEELKQNDNNIKLREIIANDGYLNIEVIKYLMLNNSYFKNFVANHSKKLYDYSCNAI